MLFMVFLLCGVGGVHHMLVVQSLLFRWKYGPCSVLVVRSLLCVGGAVLVVCWWCGPHSVLLV